MKISNLEENTTNYSEYDFQGEKNKTYSVICINKRLNMIHDALRGLLGILINSFKPDDCDQIVSLVDSMPIVTCKGRNRIGKVTRDIADKGYCSTKNMYYHGIRLHLVGHRRLDAIPYPEIIVLAPASENGLTVFKRECINYLPNKTVFGDKIYADSSFFNGSCLTKMLTPHKEIKGEADVIKKRERASRDLLSHAVSKVRQPIEAFFNWLNEKTEIQRACKVRASKGLLVHVFGKLAAAMLTFCNF